METLSKDYLNKLIMETEEIFKSDVSIEKRKAALNLNCSALAMRIIILKEELSKM